MAHVHIILCMSTGSFKISGKNRLVLCLLHCQVFLCQTSAFLLLKQNEIIIVSFNTQTLLCHLSDFIEHEIKHEIMGISFSVDIPEIFIDNLSGGSSDNTSNRVAGQRYIFLAFDTVSSLVLRFQKVFPQ